MVQDRLIVSSSTGSPSASSSPLSSETPMDLAAVVEVALGVQLERLRVTEALAACDNAVAVVYPFTDEPEYIQEIQYSDSCTGTEDQTDDEKGINFEKTCERNTPRNSFHLRVRSDSPSSWVRITTPPKTTCSDGHAAHTSRASNKLLPGVNDDLNEKIALSSFSLEGGPEKTIATQHSILAALPLPSDIPEEELQPIFPPRSYSLGDFLRDTTGPVSLARIVRLKNYHVLSQVTTYWCPDWEEHGYFLTPAFKCITNPRLVTAHRWLAVDVLGHMREPTECFYYKDRKWYYSEWELLSTEVQEMTTQALIKESLAGRKNVSPQNTYETGQLYAVGALRISCVGLQCIGFNNEVYHAVLEQSWFVHWTRNSGWTSPIPPPGRHDGTSDDSKSSVD
ncbi:hypothetical protein EDD16DRAFT_1517707 [Pisolithus croceorrhizus]|nr:hypothetical protein EDD16DRAFT_1517707 [Pisolithus croceorrhizus]KAI6150217.1 hypothetical protein EDD17DRAFT_1513576 [Pisolithus thermaeus]